MGYIFKKGQKTLTKFPRDSLVLIYANLGAPLAQARRKSRPRSLIFHVLIINVLSFSFRSPDSSKLRLTYFTFPFTPNFK